MSTRSRRLRPVTVAAIVGTVLLILVAIAGPLVWMAPATTTAVPDRLLQPSLAHPFGTDDLGRDILSRSFFGTRVALRSSAQAVGLGLAIVKRFADRLSYKIQVRSVLGRGSVFKILIPAEFIVGTTH